MMQHPQDYDVVVVGSAVAGLGAAQQAAQARARVAWVTLDTRLDTRLDPKLAAGFDSRVQMNPWTEAGIDCIDSPGYFLPGGQGFQTTLRPRPLRARSYLLALPAVGLVSPQWSRGDWQLSTDLEPVTAAGASWGVWGAVPESLAVCEYLLDRGCGVQLFRPKPWRSGLLQRIQVYLEGRGVVCYPAQRFPEIQTTLQHFWGVERWGWEAVDINLPALQPGLTLPLRVDRFLRCRQGVNHPQLYGCGMVLGGSAAPDLALSEARTAVMNALYGPHRILRYETLPYRVLAKPCVIQVGWTLDRMQSTSSPAFWSPSEYYSLTLTGFADESLHPLLPALLRVVLHRDGRILGAEGIGQLAAQGVTVMALARQQGLRWSSLLKALPGGEVAELLQALQAQKQEREYAAGGGGWRDSFFNWRRTGFI